MRNRVSHLGYLGSVYRPKYKRKRKQNTYPAETRDLTYPNFESHTGDTTDNAYILPAGPYVVPPFNERPAQQLTARVSNKIKTKKRHRKSYATTKKLDTRLRCAAGGKAARVRNTSKVRGDALSVNLARKASLSTSCFPQRVLPLSPPPLRTDVKPPIPSPGLPTTITNNTATSLFKRTVPPIPTTLVPAQVMPRVLKPGE